MNKRKSDTKRKKIREQATETGERKEGRKSSREYGKDVKERKEK